MALDNQDSNSKADAAYLKLQKQISKAQKTNAASITTFLEAKKEILENNKQIAIVEQQILELEGLKTKEGDLQAAKLALQVKQLKELNKKVANLGTALRAVGNTMVNQLIPSWSEIYDKAISVDKAIKNTAASMALGSNQSATLRTSLRGAASTAEALNVTTEQLVGMQSAYADETGRSSILSSEAMKSMVNLAVGINMSAEGMGNLTGQMEAFGMGAEKSVEVVKEVRDIAESQGVNAGKVVKKFQQNLKLLNKLDFKGGAKGMAKMAAYSEKYKISMEAVAGVSEKVFRPEGAIEAAANLQMLGGSLSQLGDPFTLMHKARYAPLELAKSLSQAASQSAVFNEETGEFELNALELDRMREAAGALGMNMDDLVTTAKATAKMNMFGGMLSGISNSEDKELLSGLATMNKGGQAVINMVDVDGKRKEILLKDMTSSQADLLRQQKLDAEDLALQNKTLDDAWKGMKSQLLALAADVLIPFLDAVTPLVQKFTEWIAGWEDSSKKWLGGGILIAAGLVAFGSKALTLVKSIGSAVGWIIKGIRGIGKDKASSIAKSSMSDQSNNIGKKGYNKDGSMDKRTKAYKNSQKSPGRSGGGKGQGGMMDKFLKIKPAQLLALGAAMIMVAASLWVFAKAAQELETVSWEAIGKGLGSMIVMMAALGITAALLGPVSPIVMALGASMLMLGAGVFLAAAGMSLLVDSFTGLAGVIGTNGSSLLLAGVGFMAMAAGIGMLSMALIGLSAAAAVSLLGLGMLVAVTGVMVGAAYALEKADFSGVITGINNLDIEKVNALKELASLSNSGKPIRIEFSDMNLKGDISLSGDGGGGSVSTDWIRDPIFLSNLKDIIAQEMEKGKNGNTI